MNAASLVPSASKESGRTPLRIGSTFSGYGGLDLAVRLLFPDAVTAFVADVCKHDEAGVGHHEPHRAPCTVLARRFPEAPNLGDVTLVDWRPWRGLVDLFTAGFPCQDVSAAGKRAGLKRGTRTGLWHEVARAIKETQPPLVLLENVRGLLSARGDAPTAEHEAAEATAEACRRLTRWLDARHAQAINRGDEDHARKVAARRVRAMGCRRRALARVRRHERSLVRAIGTVLGTLADLGYDAAWCGLRAADVGAAHGRFRVFILAWPAANADGIGYERSGSARRRGTGSADSGREPADLTLLPTPTTRDTKGRNQRDDDTCLTGALLPTPRATDGTKGGPNQRGSSGDPMLPSAVALLPTLKASNNETRQSEGYDNGGENYRAILDEGRWGAYAAAIHRWAQVIGRDAPAPTQLSAKGNPQLSAAFAEWLMGLPAGWITEVPGITRNEALKAAGNGVVPQQGAAALAWLLVVAARAGASLPDACTERLKFMDA